MPARDVLLAVVVALIWAFNFIVVAVGLSSFPPLFFSALRFVVVAFPAVFLVSRAGIPWRTIGMFGLVLGVVNFSLLYLGMSLGMPPGLSSLVLQAQAVFTPLLAWLLLRDPPGRATILGVGLACVGMAVIGVDYAAGATLAGFVLVLGAAVSWAYANILLKKAGALDMPRLVIWLSLVPPLPLLVLSALFEEGQWQALAGIDWLGAGSILYAGWGSSVCAYALWGGLMRRHSPNAVAPFTLLVPVFGFAMAALILDEALSPTRLWASALVLAGVGLAALCGGDKRLSAASGPSQGDRPWPS